MTLAGGAPLHQMALRPAPSRDQPPPTGLPKHLPCSAPSFYVQTQHVPEDTANIAASRQVVVYEADQELSIWHYANPLAAIARLWSLRRLAWSFVVRDVHGRYRGSYMGIFWAVITPLLSLAVYTFIFVGVIGVSWPKATGFVQPALFIFSGLIAFSVFAECMHGASSIITNHPNYVKKVVFPLELLPFSMLGTAIVHSLFSVAVAVVAQLIITSRCPWTLILLPLAYLPLVAMTLGLSWIFATLGVFVRDIGNLMGVVVQILMFITPIFFPPERMSQRRLVGGILQYNPIAIITDSFRRVINEGQLLDWPKWGLLTAVSLVLAMAGYMFFKRMERSLADAV